MRLYSYVVARDYGFAPNPFYGFCTLATCKPEIRRTAAVGDWIIGTHAKKTRIGTRLVYAMKVTEDVTFDEYWRDERFQQKKPNLKGSKKQAFGDNIYHCGPSGLWIQEDSHHSFEGGNPNHANIINDTKTDRVLISKEFAYWGSQAPEIPEVYRSEVVIGRAHKCNFEKGFVETFLGWVISGGETGYRGNPLQF